MVSQAKIDANRRNARRSTGPRTDEGKERARLNALKHGATAQIPVLPGEDPAFFLGRVEDYKAALNPQNTLESDLIEQAALMKVQFDRASRVVVARATERVLTAQNVAALAREQEADALGQRLFFDRRGPTAVYPNGEFIVRQQRTSSAAVAEDPDDPARLVKELESTGPGCRWLLDRWAELRARLETGGYWQSPEKLKAIRLLGRQPLDAADETEVTTVFLASHALDPRHKNACSELRCDLDESEFKRYMGRLSGRDLDAMRPADAAAAREALLALVDRATDRLKPLAAVHQLLDDKLVALQPDIAASDGSTEEERLRRYALACNRGMRSTIDSIFKIRKAIEASESDPLEPADAAYVPAVAGANGFHQNEATGAWHDHQNEPTAADWQDRQNEPTAGAPDTVYDVDAAYREAMTAAMAMIRNPGASSQGINMVRLEQAIVANAREAVRFEDLDNEDMGNTCHRPQDQSPADFANKEFESVHAETGLRQNEPTGVQRDRQNEPTGGCDPIQQNEPTKAIEARQNEPTDDRQNETTDLQHDRQNELTDRFDPARQNEPTDRIQNLQVQAALDDAGFRDPCEHRTAAAGLPARRLEWFQILEELAGAPEPAKPRPAFPVDDRKHRRDRKARNKLRQRSNNAPARFSPSGGPPAPGAPGSSKLVNDASQR